MSAWPKVKLGEVLRQTSARVSVNAEAAYPNFGIFSYGRGLFRKPPISGTTTRATALYRARAGQFVYSRLFAFEGAYAAVPSEFEGFYVSNEFPLFDVDPEKLNVEFLVWYLGIPAVWAAIAESASGVGHRRQRVQPENLLAYEIPLPPLAEQRRVVARIEELAAQIHEARTLRQQATEEAEVLVARATSRCLDEGGWSTAPLGNLLAEKPRNGLGPQPEATTGGRQMLRINAVSSSPTRFVDMMASKAVEVSANTAEPFVVRNDDVFIVRYNGDINRVAKPAIYKGSNRDGIVYPDKLIRLRTNVAKMSPDFLVFALNSRMVRSQIEELGKTTAGNIGVSGADAQSFVVPVPPLSDQRRIVAELDALQAEVATLKRHQAETAAELDALLPALLDRAFKGEL